MMPSAEIWRAQCFHAIECASHPALAQVVSQLHLLVTWQCQMWDSDAVIQTTTNVHSGTIPGQSDTEKANFREIGLS